MDLELPSHKEKPECQTVLLALRALLLPHWQMQLTSKNLFFQNFGILGFDDISAPGYAELPQPELTTIHVDRKEMGRISVETLFDVMHHPGKAKYRYTLPVSLVVRGSTAPLS